MAEILPIRRKTLSNQSINEYIHVMIQYSTGVIHYHMRLPHVVSEEYFCMK